MQAAKGKDSQSVNHSPNEQHSKHSSGLVSYYKKKFADCQDFDSRRAIFNSFRDKIHHYFD